MTYMLVTGIVDVRFTSYDHAYCIIPAWSPTQIVRIPLSLFPDNVARGNQYTANYNLNADGEAFLGLAHIQRISSVAEWADQIPSEKKAQIFHNGV